MNAGEAALFAALRDKFPAREFALLPQVGNATGFKTNRHADALALGLWPSRGMELHGFEFKTSRADWRRELRDPAKADEMARFCDRWWIVSSEERFIPLEELPATWGLLVAHGARGTQVKMVRQASALPTPPPLDLTFLAAMLRSAQDVIFPEATVAQLQEVRSAGVKEGMAAGAKAGELRQAELQAELLALRQKVHRFEQESGVHFSTDHGWFNQRRPSIGAAVRFVQTGGLETARAELEGIAERALSLHRLATTTIDGMAAAVQVLPQPPMVVDAIVVEKQEPPESAP